MIVQTQFLVDRKQVKIFLIKHTFISIAPFSFSIIFIIIICIIIIIVIASIYIMSWMFSFLFTIFSIGFFNLDLIRQILHTTLSHLTFIQTTIQRP